MQIPEYLDEIFPNVHTLPVSHTKTIIELTTPLNQCAKENELHEVNNIAVTNLANELRAEFDNQDKSLKKHRGCYSTSIRNSSMRTS